MGQNLRLLPKVGILYKANNRLASTRQIQKPQIVVNN